MALFRKAFFRLFALVFRHFAWRISFFRLFAWRYFVFSFFRLAFFRYFVFSLGVISSWRRAITPGEKTKERNNEMAQTSHHMFQLFHRLLTQCGPIFLRALALILYFCSLNVFYYKNDECKFSTPVNLLPEYPTLSGRIEILYQCVMMVQECNNRGPVKDAQRHNVTATGL